MISRKTIYFNFFILCFSISSDVGNSELLGTVCNETMAYNVTTLTGMLFRRNMASLFSVLSSNASQPNGFYSYSVGGGISEPAVYGLFLCRGDATVTVCQTCLNSAVAEILQSCSNVTRGITWFDYCMLRYSDQPIVSKLQTEGGMFNVVLNNVSDYGLLNRTLGEVFSRITNDAAYGNLPGKKFAVAVANYTDFSKVFALGQCTPDLTNLDCESCLREAITHVPSDCSNQETCYILHPSCNLMYSLYPFFHAVIPPPLPPAPTPPPPPSLLPPPPSLPSLPPDGGGASSATISTASAAFVVAIFFIGAA